MSSDRGRRRHKDQDTERDAGSRRAPRGPPSRLWSPGRARWLKRLARVFYVTVARVEVSGVENVPDDGAGLLVFNHLSSFDVHLIFAYLERADVTGLVAAEYRTRPVARRLVEWGGGIWLDRRRGGGAGVRKALRLLDRGWIVGISPEGGRTATGGLRRGKPGAAYLALRSGVPVIPVAVTGTERLHRSLPRFRRPTVSVRFGRPRRLIPPPGVERRERLAAATDRIMNRLAALLPFEYRGVYEGAPERYGAPG